MARRRMGAWVALAIGVGLIAAPSIFGMWQRAPRGAQMIQGFSSIMSARNVPVIAGYGRTVLGGFGDSPQIIEDAAHHFSGGHITLDYQQASNFIQKQPDLGGLAYTQRELPTLGPPFSTLLSLLYKDQPYFSGMVGLPNFALFPWFFVLPGLLVAAGAVAFLRRDGRPDAQGTPTGARKPAILVGVVGVMLAAAPMLPMPPGFHSIRTVGPHGATVLADFAGPLGSGSPQPVMSMRTVHQFDQYVSEMNAASAQIVPAVRDSARVFAHVQISSTAARSFLASDPNLLLANTLATGFAPMYRQFHNMLATMALDMGDYQAVRALPSFKLFPYFFLIPGLLLILAAFAGMLRGKPVLRSSGAPGGSPDQPDPVVALAAAGAQTGDKS